MATAGIKKWQPVCRLPFLTIKIKRKVGQARGIGVGGGDIATAYLVFENEGVLLLMDNVDGIQMKRDVHRIYYRRL